MRRTCAWTTLVGALFVLSVVPGPRTSLLAQGPGVGLLLASSGGRAESKTPLPRSVEERKILDVLEDMVRTQRYMENVPQEDGRLLRLLTEAIGARHVIEIGTSSGYSGLWMCLALKSTGGRLTTFEIDPQRAALARKNFMRAGVDHLVTIVEGDAHREVLKLKGPIDLVFIDADKPDYIDYLIKLLPLVRPGGLILGHNMNSPAPDPAYVKAITTNPDLETLFLLMEGSGVGVTLKKR